MWIPDLSPCSNLFHLQTFPSWLLAASSFGCYSQTLWVHLQLLSVSKHPTPHPSGNPIGSTYNIHLESSTSPLLSSCIHLCPPFLSKLIANTSSLLLLVLFPVGFSQLSSHTDPFIKGLGVSLLCLKTFNGSRSPSWWEWKPVSSSMPCPSILLTFSSVRLPSDHFASAALTSFFFLEHIRWVLALESLNCLFSLSGVVFPRDLCDKFLYHR